MKMASRKLPCNVSNQDVIALLLEGIISCMVCLKRVHLTCSKHLLDAQASSVVAYECFSCNGIQGLFDTFKFSSSRRKVLSC